MKLKLMIFVSALLFIITACGTDSTYDEVESEKGQALVEDEETIVIDVRTPEEYESGHIPQSELLPLKDLPDALDSLDSDASYLLVCRSGNRSAEAAEMFVDAGIEDVTHLAYGVGSWEGEWTE
ncbi:rhodanese-related sulfurtransferase [Salsuginibacillus halophilus]|uniref:Rhodanese-related sulfurtransferase n=1 Tax=Salsuginibacillus halophilus TaxID=517424 RepID=A0A2P8H9A2_9BACI|nr:rhodanese-like domain-containing protein [Salsuginibacillus halophilus]PSL42784.1 rhodanese-related sulfurtransferase [Salsuginibacillus halophilus]